MEFIVLSGLSGSGKSKGAEILEDLGYYCIDNMPPELLPKFAEMCMSIEEKYKRVALVMDIRGGADFKGVLEYMDKLKDTGAKCTILFFEASTEVIMRRYKETRRPHPLANSGLSPHEMVLREYDRLEDIRLRADYVIDTSSLPANKLREYIISLISSGVTKDEILDIRILSFGYKYGVPTESDLVFDVRFIPNPYYEEDLREKTGLDREVKDFVFSCGETQAFLPLLTNMLGYLIPQYVNEGKTLLTISIGCTGGKHRSVAISEHLKSFIHDLGYRSATEHKDLIRYKGI